MLHSKLLIFLPASFGMPSTKSTSGSHIFISRSSLKAQCLAAIIHDASNYLLEYAAVNIENLTKFKSLPSETSLKALPSEVVASNWSG